MALFLRLTSLSVYGTIFGYFFILAQQPTVGHGFLIYEVPRSHTDTPQSVGLLWTSDQPVAETSI